MKGEKVRLTAFSITLIALTSIAALLLLGVLASWIIEAVREKPSAEWAPGELDTLVIERRLEHTGLIDMSWLMTHEDFNTIEETTRAAVQRVTDDACSALTDDDEWPGYDYTEMTDPCQPIGCDNGFHLAGCPFIEIDARK